MALATGSTTYNSFDRGTSLADTGVRNVSDLMFAALNSHPGSLISMIASAEPTPSRKHEWVEQSLNPGTVALAEAVDNSETAIDVSNADALTVTVGDLLHNKSENINELIQVTAVGAADSGAGGAGYAALTVVRGYGASAAQAHTNGSTMEIIPQRQEGSSIGSDRTRDRTTRYNYTQIFDTAIKLSRNMLYQPMYNVTSEFENSLMHRTIELKNRINYAFLNSTMVSGGGAPSSTVYGGMQGIIPMILTAGDATATSYTAASAGTVIDPTTTLTYDSISDLIGVIAVSNGNRDGQFVIACPQTQYEKIATFADGQIRRQYSPSGQTYGGTVDTLVSKQGIVAKVVLEPDMPVGHLAVLDTSRIKLKPYQDSAMLMYIDDLGFNGNDYKQARLVAEWTLEMHNCDTAHGLMNAITG